MFKQLKMRLWSAGAMCVCMVGLTACSTSYYSGPVSYTPSNHKAPVVTGKRKVGKPYKIMGKWYTPIHSSEGYKQKGIASWYGKEFHGKKTANGEVYDMHAFTAAHTTLPLPTYVRVTNLENGRHIKVRVNDRGPFLRGRLIDMSYAGAKALGFAEQGTARVLVEAYPTNGTALNAAPRARQRMAYVAPKRPVSSGFTHRISQKASPKTGMQQTNTQQMHDALSIQQSVPIYVQTGAFSSFPNAQKQKQEIEKYYNTIKIVETQVNGKPFYRVRVGPIQAVHVADQVLAKLAYEGYKEAIIVLED